MALYTIGDLHLSLGGSKPMDIFGDKWANHVERLRESFSHLTADDVTVLAGDLSWGISLEESLPDFQFIDALPGRKIILKGNHDYWWGTATKMKKFFEAHGIESIDILFNNCFFYGDYALCGTRGWFYEEDAAGTHTGKMLAREALRLEASFKAAAHPLLPALSAALPGLPVSGAARAHRPLPRRALLLRTSARPHAPPRL